ncbi:DUF6973 domain-containing protein [Dyadobacter arcticus]|uniref:DUF6973 domain-containing protein n=1 Tax=Dyadobacter arcticus TaxID=1078754 RepID=A0ABX0UFU8_9BACT|nr:hypothetical protein [Dyadobacter arcticus]NIJ51872.1 hypothetical protein [Dyadobacter arcticus]
MKKLVKSALLLLVIAFTLFSCREPEMEVVIHQNETSKIEIIDFKGEKVAVQSDFPKELFEQSQEGFDRYYKSIAGVAKSRTSGEDVHITYQELLPILVKHLSKFPRINSEDEISEKDLHRIFQDFPEIRTRQAADDRRMVIFDFYQTLAKRDIVKDVIALENAGRNGRVADISPASLTTPEKNHLLANPGYAQWYVQAANEANSLTQGLYIDEDLGDKANAFKHSTWNALSIRFILKGSPASENQAIDFTQDGTSKHEQNDAGGQIYDKHSAMDLHNNMSARVWMEKETKWGIGPFRNMPNIGDIVNTMSSRANSSALESMSTILSWHGGDNAVTWGNLYNNMYGAHQHLVHVDP